MNKYPFYFTVPDQHLRILRDLIYDRVPEVVSEEEKINAVVGLITSAMTEAFELGLKLAGPDKPVIEGVLPPRPFVPLAVCHNGCKAAPVPPGKYCVTCVGVGKAYDQWGSDDREVCTSRPECYNGCETVPAQGNKYCVECMRCNKDA
jgi:hypothetical protein